MADALSGWCPFAKQQPLYDHFEIGTIANRNTIVLHITQGTTTAGAIATFKASSGRGSTSAHFVIDRDGSITQLISIVNTAWHASQANKHSVGIEHVALSASGAEQLNKIYAPQITAGKQKPWVYMPATDVQYAASAKLLQWLAGQMSIPIDRDHIRTHNEASPIDHHVECCTGALDPDKLVTLAKAAIV